MRKASQILSSTRSELIASRLIKYTVEAVHARLDRIYLEATNGRGNALKGIEALDNAEITALLDELESLYTEILPVAQMSAEQQYLEPALRLIASHVVQGEERSSKAIESVRSSLKLKVNPQDIDKETDLPMSIRPYRQAPRIHSPHCRIQ